MSQYVVKKPHGHPSGSVKYMKIRQSGVITAYGMAWEGSMPALTHRNTTTSSPPTSGDMVIWALAQGAAVNTFDHAQARHFELDSGHASQVAWLGSYNTPEYDLLVGWRVLDQATWNVGTSANSEEACTTPSPIGDLWDFVDRNMVGGATQSDYGFSQLYVGDKFAGVVAQLSPLTGDKDSSHEVWRLGDATSSASLGYSMSTSLSDTFDADAFRSHTKSYVRELMVQMDVAGYPLSIYLMNLLKYDP